MIAWVCVVVAQCVLRACVRECTRAVVRVCAAAYQAGYGIVRWRAVVPTLCWPNYASSAKQCWPNTMYCGRPRPADAKGGLEVDEYKRSVSTPWLYAVG